MPKRYEWAGGYCAVWYDPDAKDIVWWGAEHPKGGHEYDAHVKPDSFVKFGLGGVDDVPPADILRALYADVAADLGLPAEPVSERLCAAARGGDLKTMRELLDAGVSVETRDLSGRQTVLDHAFQAHQDAASELLVERGVSTGMGYLKASRALTAKAWRTFLALAKKNVNADDGTLKSAWGWLLAAAPTDVLDVIRAKVPAVAATGWDRDDVKKRLAADAAFSQWAERVR